MRFFFFFVVNIRDQQKVWRVWRMSDISVNTGRSKKSLTTRLQNPVRKGPVCDMCQKARTKNPYQGDGGGGSGIIKV